ncbi:MAG TPA: hypothetical protein VGA45_08780, partial [Actinomycetota bacterium]
MGFRDGTPGEVLLTGQGEEFIALVLEAMGQVEAARTLHDQCPVPRALPPGDLPPRGVEGESR